jgi:UDP:flavonoid glycosyltransferase YjiC (YdhE family)
VARIAFAWELGAGYGHAKGCAALARALEANGHACAFMFREREAIATLAECGHYESFQAPVAPLGGGAATPLSFADILLACGYGDPSTLAGLVSGWRDLFTAWEPDLVVADSAPTALVAARLLGLKRVAFGNGFAIPPLLDPLPAFRHDRAIDPAELAASTARALANVNCVLAAQGAVPSASLAQQFETHEAFLCTFPELDHYDTRPRSAYWGPRFDLEGGDDARWPYGEGPRVLVSLRSVVPQLDALIDALVAQRCRVVAFIPGLEAARRARLRSAQRRVAERPVRLAPLLPSCDLVVSEGGDLAGGALMSAVPQLLLPTHYEQSVTALRIEQLGGGLRLAPDSGPEDLAGALRQLLREPRFRAAARQYASRYAAFSTAEQQRRIVLRIGQILAGPILSPTPTRGSPR